MVLGSWYLVVIHMGRCNNRNNKNKCRRYTGMRPGRNTVCTESIVTNNLSFRFMNYVEPLGRAAFTLPSSYSCCDSDCDCDCDSPVDVHNNLGSVGIFPNLTSLLNVSANCRLLSQFIFLSASSSTGSKDSIISVLWPTKGPGWRALLASSTVAHLAPCPGT